ncbi:MULTISPECIES: hypothetical protein [unclassified Streptomyces]|uniref:hypothetical protein n=1 Tax=unclassified Streptomyces TaxID=2593676 RepID=UPI0006AF60C0|nr:MULTISPECIES: hypothetical protein [unclassified Streptomyces]KOU78994.1 hypothetical protein ADK93_34940 [Streptomyces sp. XY58]KOV00650.1 hypothetical protein ADK89_33275 [Streptomyces sp. XY37]
MPDKPDPCGLLDGPAKYYCQGRQVPGPGGAPPGWKPKDGGGGGTLTEGASQHVTDLANYLIEKIEGLLAPADAWAPETADSWLYQQFLWLGQHLAVAIFVCVIVVCALTAWQGAPRLRQMGASTGWTLAAVAGMAAVPGVVVLLNEAVSSAFTTMFHSNESTLFAVIEQDLKTGADSGNPLAILIITAALVVALALAALVCMTRNLAILVFVCMAPLVLASLARGGDMTAVKTWAMRLLGLIFAPFALILVSPFVEFAKGALVVDAVLLVGADVLMLRMIFHGIPYFGPRIAGAVRGYVESRTSHPLAHAVVRAGSPTVYEQENTPRQPRTVDTPGRAAHRDRGVLLAAYGVQQRKRGAQLTTASAIDKAQREAPRSQQLIEARRQARAAAAQTTNPSIGATPSRPAPAPSPSSGPVRGAGGPPPPRNP